MNHPISTALRCPAEWESQSAVQLTFPHENSDWADLLQEVLPCFIEVAVTISRYQKVIVVCQNATSTAQLLAAADQNNLLLIECASNDTWARDHGGITVFDEAGDAVIVDYMFNGWGLKFRADLDNQITRHLYNKGVFNARIMHGGMVLEGGGIESDGQGTILTTAECLLSPNRNPHLSQSEIEDELRLTLGAQRILWLHHGYLAGDDTDSHIDTLARLCSPDTIAYVQCTDPHDEHYSALREMETELKALKKQDGTPYNIVPLPWPDACFAKDGHRLPATYANFLFINGAVLVPVYGVAQDEQALSVFKTLFPDRDIVGINCRVLIEQHGSLHCITMQYPAGVVC